MLIDIDQFLGACYQDILGFSFRFDEWAISKVRVEKSHAESVSSIGAAVGRATVCLWQVGL